MTDASFGALLRDYRRRRGITQGKLAALAYCSPSLISRFERGVRQPRYPSIVSNLGAALSLTEQESRILLEAAGFAPRLMDGQQRASVDAEVVSKLEAIEASLANLTSLMAERNEDSYVRGWRDLVNEFRYVDRQSQEMAAKLSIAKWIVTEMIRPQGPSCKMALDSGTTTATIASCLVDHQVTVLQIFTNSAVVLPTLVNRFAVLVGGGEFKTPGSWNSFGAILGSHAEEMARDFPADLTFVGATSISFASGPCAPTREDASFKRALIQGAKEHGSRVVFPVDYRKLLGGPKAGDQQVFEKSEWEEVRDSILVVTAGMPNDKEDCNRLALAEKSFGERLRRIDEKEMYSEP